MAVHYQLVSATISTFCTMKHLKEIIGKWFFIIFLSLDKFTTNQIVICHDNRKQLKLSCTKIDHDICLLF